MSGSISLNNKKKKKIKKKANEETSDVGLDTESSEEELDLTKECHPISHYVNDRAEMINQMFSVIKGKKLKAMLPPILRDFELEKLKLQCLDQLLGMSEKRIQCILDGENLESSSESEVASEDSEDSQDSSNSSSSSGKIDRTSQGSRKRRQSKAKSDSESEGHSKIPKLVPNEQAPDTGKTLLEILELEMRARAIRALLNQGADNSTETAENTEAGGDVVDLTIDEDDFPRVIKTEPESTMQEQTFQEKIEKVVVKPKIDEEEKKKLLAELELRNRLKKKKTYRTRQQRMANEEEVEPSKREEPKQLEVEPEGPEKAIEIVIEDPEDGEVSSEEEPPPPVVVKEEKSDSPEPGVPSDKVMDGERITAIDDGNFVRDANMEFEEGHDESEVKVLEEGEKNVEEIEISDEENADVNQEGREDNEVDAVQEGTSEASQEFNSQNNEISETSWRERWYNKEDIQKVVKSSKMCSKVKKRLASRITKESPSIVSTEAIVEQSGAVVEGSVTEYQQLSKEDTKGNELSDIGEDGA